MHMPLITQNFTIGCFILQIGWKPYSGELAFQACNKLFIVVVLLCGKISNYQEL